MLRGEPTRVDLQGFSSRVAATDAHIVVCVTSAIERSTEGLHRPRRLLAFDWWGSPLWVRDVAEGRGDPRIDFAGVVWLAEAQAIFGVSLQGEEVERIDVTLPAGDRIGAFVVLPDGGFVVAVESPGGRRGPRGRVLRLGRSGAVWWSRELMPGMLQHSGVVSMRTDEDWQAKPMSPWRPQTWECVHNEPLLVAGDAVLCGFYEWPRSGIGRRSLLGLRRGDLLWSSGTGPGGRAAIAGPGSFLVGTQGYGAFRTDRIDAGGVRDTWGTQGPYLVTDHMRVVEMENDTTAEMHTATLGAGGTLVRGQRLPGYHTGGPVALADGSLLMWRAGELLQIDPGGNIVRRHSFGVPLAAAGRVVTNGQGRFAFAVSDGEYGRGSWPLWIVSTDLPGLCSGPWPCDGAGSHNTSVLPVTEIDGSVRPGG